MSVANVELVRHLFELASIGDIDGYAAHIDGDAELRPLHGERVFRGPAGLREYFGELAGTGTEIDATPVRFEDRGDWVLVTGRLRVRNGGSLSDSPVFWALQVRDGKVLRTRSYGTADDAEAALSNAV